MESCSAQFVNAGCTPPPNCFPRPDLTSTSDLADAGPNDAGALDGAPPDSATCPPEPDLWLVFAVLKRDASELVVEKATELGVARICPVITERTNIPRINAERWRAIATEAAEQCERLSVPAIADPVSLPTLLRDWPPERPLFAALERRDAAFPLAPPSVGLLIGPEGGFAEMEVELLRRHPFVEGVGLGPRILRAETAAIVGLALLQSGVLLQAGALLQSRDGG